MRAPRYNHQVIEARKISDDIYDADKCVMKLSHRNLSLRATAALVQAERAISTGKLRTLLRFHTRPINVMVCHGSHREYWF